MATREELLREAQKRGLVPAKAPGPQEAPSMTAEELANWKPGRLPPRNPDIPLGKRIRGNVGEMISGVPVVGPALLSGTQKASALKHSVIGDETYDKALERIETEQQNWRRQHPLESASAGAGGATVAFGALGGGGPGVIGRALQRGMGTIGSPFSRAWFGGLSGGTIGGADAQVRGQDPVKGALIGMGASVAPAVGLRAITPFPARKDRTEAAQRLRKVHKIFPMAGQATGNRWLQNLESVGGGSKQQDWLDDIGDQTARAIAKPMGANVDRINSKAMRDTKDRIGAEYDYIENTYSMPLDMKLRTDLNKAWNDFADVVGESSRGNVVKGVLQDLAPHIRAGGRLRGDVYRATRSRMRRAAKNTSDPELKKALFDIRNAMDDAMERGITNPRDKQRLRTARQQYHAMKIVEAARKNAAGSAAALGAVTPARLRGAIGTDSVYGTGPYGRLSEDMNAVLEQPPQSGTEPRTRIRNILTAPGTMIGGGLAGGFSGDWATGAMGAAAGGMANLALPWMAGRTVMNPIVNRYLSNQVMGKFNPRTMEGGELYMAIAKALQQGVAQEVRRYGQE